MRTNTPQTIPIIITIEREDEFEEEKEDWSKGPRICCVPLHSLFLRDILWEFCKVHVVKILMLD